MKFTSIAVVTLQKHAQSLKRISVRTGRVLGLLLLAAGIAHAQPIPIGHWTFDEASSGTGTGTVLDSAAGAHDGIINGSAVYTPGVVGTGALSFDGVNDHVIFPTTTGSALDLEGTNYTIAFWLKYNSTQLGRIINMTEAADCSGGYTVFLSGGFMRTTHSNFGSVGGGIYGCNDTSNTFPQPPATNVWVHVAVVYDEDLGTGTITTYYDGISQGGFTDGGPGQPSNPPINPLTSDGNDPLRFGTYNGSGQLFKGSLDDVRIYDVALSAAEIFQLTGGTEYACSGFQSPMDDGPVKVKKNRNLPFKALLLDGIDYVDDSWFALPPVIQVSYDDEGGTANDVSPDEFATGPGTDGNQFEFNGDHWKFNLKSKAYTSPGTYTVTMVSGDSSEYVIAPTCTAEFVVQ